MCVCVRVFMFFPFSEGSIILCTYPKVYIFYFYGPYSFDIKKKYNHYCVVFFNRMLLKLARTRDSFFSSRDGNLCKRCGCEAGGGWV